MTNPTKIFGAFAIMASTGTIAAASHQDGLFSANVAAWVQAFGSIGAIVAAAWLAGRQSAESLSREERARSEARDERLEALAAHRAAAKNLMTSCYIRVQAIADGLKKDKEVVGSYSIESVASLSRRVQAFRTENLRSDLAMFYFEQTDSSLNIFRIHLERRAASIGKLEDPASRATHIGTLAREAQQQADELRGFLLKFDEACRD